MNKRLVKILMAGVSPVFVLMLGGPAFMHAIGLEQDLADGATRVMLIFCLSLPVYAVSTTASDTAATIAAIESAALDNNLLPAFVGRAGLAILSVAMVPLSSLAQQAGPYKVLQAVKVGGEGGFDYVYADDMARRLYVPRGGPEPAEDWVSPRFEPKGAGASALSSENPSGKVTSMSSSSDHG